MQRAARGRIWRKNWFLYQAAPSHGGGHMENILCFFSFTAVVCEKGQLGHGDKVLRDMSTSVFELSRHKIVIARTGRSHSVVVTEDGLSFAFGCNKHEQLGSGSAKTGSSISSIYVWSFRL